MQIRSHNSGFSIGPFAFHNSWGTTSCDVVSVMVEPLIGRQSGLDALDLARDRNHHQQLNSV